MNTWINLTALWKIIVIGILAGAGLPALFAVGLRALNPRTEAVAAPGGPASAEGGTAAASGPQRAGILGATVAVVCFAVVLAAIGWGIYSIVNNS